MWWHDKRTDRSGFSAHRGAGQRGAAPAPAVLGHGRVLAHGRIIRAAAALVIAALAGGCFQPLYGEQSPTGGPGLRGQLRAGAGPPVAAPKGTSEGRIAGRTRNPRPSRFTRA